MKKLLILAALFVSLGCHRHDSSNPQNNTPNVQGVWDGNVTVDGTTKNFYFIIDQHDTVLGGIWNLNNGEKHGHLTGSISGTELDFTLDEGPDCVNKFTGTADLANRQLQISFSGTGNAACTPAITNAAGFLGR